MPCCGWRRTRPATSPACRCGWTRAATSSGTTTTTRAGEARRSTVKVFVDSGRCQGHTLCSMIAPDSFELSDIDGTSSPVNEVVADGQEDAVREAVHSCPAQAISIEE